MLYKYMAFWKFLDLIKREQLYFRRIDKHEDQNEGRKTKPSNGLLPDSASEFQEHPASVKMWEGIDDIALKHHFICCWNLCETENPKMWKVYGEQNEAIAISTNEASLHECFVNKFIKLGKIDYTLDYNKDYNHNSHIQTRCFQKDSSFFDENELRTHFFDYTSNSEINYDHVYIDVNLDKLVKEIIISPYAPPTFEPKLREMVNNLGREYLSGRIKNSTLIN